MGIPWQNGVEVHQSQAVRRPVTGAGGAHIARHVPLDSELRRRVEPVSPRKAPPRRVPITRKPVSRAGTLRTLLEQNLLLISSVLLLLGITGWGFALYSEFRASGLIGSSSIYAETARPDTSVAKSDPFAMSTYAPSAPLPRPTAVAPAVREFGLKHHRAGLELLRAQANRRRAARAGNAGESSRRRFCPHPCPHSGPGAHRLRRPGPHGIH